MVFDFETDGTDATSCNVTELAAVPIEPKKLKILEDKGFKIAIKPPGIDTDEYFTPNVMKTIRWHAKNRNVTPEKIIEMWKDGFEEKVAWESFCKYCTGFHTKKSRENWYTDPIPAGYNIINFDMVIAKRLCEKHKTDMPFSTVKKVDCFDWLFTWFENLSQPRNLKMDTLREFFGLNSNGHAHEAMKDVMDEAKIIVKFLNFQRRQATIQKFKGAIND
jgi:hypothetical protein